MSENPYQPTNQPGPVQPPPPGTGGQNSPMAMASMGLGIAALVSAFIGIFCCLGFVSVPLSIAAIVTGFIGLNQVKTGQYTGGQFAKIGIGTGIAGFVILAIGFAIGFAIGLASVANQGI